MKRHFESIYWQREAFGGHTLAEQHQEWVRPLPDKWSIGETYYHLYLLLKRFRQLNLAYIPLAKRFIRTGKRRPYKTEIADIYQAYRNKHGKPMRAPSILLPPKDIHTKLQFQQLKQDLHHETNRLERMVGSIDNETAGHIRYPDPLAHYPNLIQSIHLIGIHEQHHFNLCEKYYKIK
ncbi:DinB family protein [Terribacillus sp. DMT04]|nr:DinB family protein [Terribacillus sp. DMT04]